MTQQPATHSDHERGLPAWGRWRTLYALWRSAEDARTRWSAVKVAAAQVPPAMRRLLERAS